MSDTYGGKLRTFGRNKAGTSNFSNPSLVSPTTPTLANPTRGFGLPKNNVIQTAIEESTNLQEAQSADEQSLLSETIPQQSFGHDISRMALRRPQAKLTVGEPGDKYEQEADWVANQVMRMTYPPTPNFQRQVEEEETEEIQTKPLVQRQEMLEEEKLIQAKCETCEQEELIQRAADGVSQVQPDLENRLNASQGGGNALPDEVRSFMEPRFGTDFSDVKVHTNSSAIQMNKDLNAQAFVHETDVYFGAGKSPGNNELTAHELTHVVQQTGKVQSKRPQNFQEMDLKGEPSRAIQFKAVSRTDVIGQPGEADTMFAQVGAMPRTMASDLTPKTLSTSHLPLLTRKQNVHQLSLMRQQTEDTSTTTTAPKNVESLHQQSHRTSKVQPMIQRDSLLDGVSNFGKAASDGVSNFGKAASDGVSHVGEAALDGMSNFAEDTAWKMIGDLAPELAPILGQGGGILEWMKNLIGSSLEGVFNGLMAPVRSIGGVENQLTAHFAPMLTSLQTAATQIANNDCTPISEAAAKIEKVAEGLITPIVEKLQPMIATIKDFFSGIWDKIGAPIWGWIKDYAADQWAKIQQLGEMLTKVTSWIWKTTGGEQMWNWLKNKLGIGDGVEGQNGLLQWVQLKVEEAWKAIAEKLEPFKKELTQIGLAVGAVALAVSPAGPVLAIGAAVAGAVQGIRWIAANWGKGNIIVQSREYLEKSLIPALQGAANRLGATFKQMAGALSSALGNLAAGMTRAVGAIGGSLLKVATSAIQWIADQVQALANWAQQQLSDLTHWLEEALDKLQTFLQKMLDLFIEVGKVVLDIWLLPAFLGKEVWTAIPECIRDPIIDFIGPIILRQIEIFQALARDNDAWQKTKADVLHIVHLVFTDRDLMGAIKATFHLILRVFNIPPDLLSTVIQKAESAWDVVSKDPLEFIKNVVRTIGKGFGLLWDNIGEHLKFGLVGWLSGGLAQNNITLPENWTEPKQVFGFALDVMGLTVDHMWELLENHFEDKKKIRKLRKRIGQVTRVIEWIDKAIDTTKSPAENTAGIIEQAKDFGSSILTGIAEWIASKVATELAVLAAAAAASGGLSEVVDIIRRIYKAIVTAVRWARQILEMVNETLDNIGAIAGGNIAAAGATFEKIMHRGMPVVIGFLADQVGLGGIGSAIKDIVTPLRATVDKVINWIIEKLKAGIEAVIGAVKSGVDAVVEWWKAKKEFKANDGETHTLFFTGADRQSTLMVASHNPKPYTQFLEWVEGNETLDDDKRKSIREAKEIAQKIEEEKGRTFGQGLSDAQQEQAQQEKQKNIEQLLEELRIPTAKLFGTDLPDWQEPELGNLNDAQFGTWMKAKTLTKVNIGKGSQPNQARHGTYDILNKRRHKGGSASYYVRGHLLNEKLGGKGIWENMTPLSRAGNGEHEAQVESLVKAALNSGAIIEYEVTPVYQERSDKSALKEEVDKHNDLNGAEIKAIIDAEDHVPGALTCHIQRLEKVNNKLQGIGSPRSWSVINQVDRNADDYFIGNDSNKKPEPININKAKQDELMAIPGITLQDADTIYNVRSKRKNPFGQYKTLAEETNINEEKLRKLNKDGYIVL